MNPDRFKPLPMQAFQGILADERIVVASQLASPYQAGQSGSLTQETLRRAFDELWNGPRYVPEPRYARRRELEEAGGWSRLPEPGPPEWTVEAGGWRLVIENGAIVGLVRIYG